MTPVITKKGSLAERLRSRLEARTARVAVVGMGYVGLPLAETFAWGGYPVLGFDIDADKVARLRRGESYIGHICGERVAEMRASGRFEATTDPARFADADAVVICVPTPLTEARDRHGLKLRALHPIEQETCQRLGADLNVKLE